ncbi:MAG: flagellar basal body-associated FliL family protein [Pseudomonadales bacterium]|nr:flagellar basal body-associated FliL family protein [Pseudomonadales bacterium]
MKIVIIVLLVVLNLGVAGGAAYFFMSKDKPAAAEGEEGAEGQEGEEGAEGEEGGGNKKVSKKRKDAIFESLEPAFVVNFEHRGAVRFLQVKVDVMSRDQGVIDAVNSLEPMIRDALLMILGSSNYESISDTEGKQLLRDEVRVAVNDILKRETGEGGIEEVYFTKFVMQ